MRLKGKGGSVSQITDRALPNFPEIGLWLRLHCGIFTAHRSRYKLPDDRSSDSLVGRVAPAE